MIQILCASCNTHLFNTDVARLDWPLFADMFDVASPGWRLRPGKLDLNIFCPVCEQFPFRHDPYQAGGNAVGKVLTIRGADGKPKLMTIKDILLSSEKPATIPQIKAATKFDGGTKPITPPAQFMLGPGLNLINGKGKVVEVFPCPACGAKKRFHKRGCALKDKHIEPAPTIAPINDPRLAALQSQVESGPERGDEPVTAAEIQEVERERENRQPSRRTETLRPEQEVV